MSTEQNRIFPAGQADKENRGLGIFAQGQRIYTAGSAGSAWRVSSGSLRLDRPDHESETSFANLAIKGDVIGAEILLFGCYTFTATALADCTLSPWPEGCAVQAGDSLLHTLAKNERRAADVIALRCGQAADRVRRLVMLLAQQRDETVACGLVNSATPSTEWQVTLPARQDMAEITALTLETVSRMVSQLRRAGILNPVIRNGFASNRFFSVTSFPVQAQRLLSANSNRVS